MRKTYPDFVDKAYDNVGSASNFGHVARDRWDTFEIDGYRKLSDVLKKSKKTSWERLYVYTTDLYIMLQFLSYYDEKYELVENLNKEELIKLMEENLDNPYINWSRIYYYFGDEYKYKMDYLDTHEKIVLNVLFKFSKKLKQENDFW